MGEEGDRAREWGWGEGEKCIIAEDEERR